MNNAIRLCALLSIGLGNATAQAAESTANDLVADTSDGEDDYVEAVVETLATDAIQGFTTFRLKLQTVSAVVQGVNGPSECLLTRP